MAFLAKRFLYKLCVAAQYAYSSRKAVRCTFCSFHTLLLQMVDGMVKMATLLNVRAFTSVIVAPALNML